MGLMHCPAANGQLVFTPHPVTLEGQRTEKWNLLPGETLADIIERVVPGFDPDKICVALDGKEVPEHLWEQLRPKGERFVEIRGRATDDSVWQIIAMAVLTYFTFGFGAATAGAWGAGAVAGYGALAATAVYMAGAVLINYALAPKMPTVGSGQQESLFSLGSAQNRMRQNEPLGLLFGKVYITPDLASKSYTTVRGNDQYLHMILTPGLNAHRVEALYNGDTLLSSYEGITVSHDGFSGMPDTALPAWTNVDAVAGGELEPGTPVVRTSPADTVAVYAEIEYLLFDVTSKGKPKNNQEMVSIEYSPIGQNQWFGLQSRYIVNQEKSRKRVSIGGEMPAGAWDVRVRRNGLDTGIENAQAEFSVSSISFFQTDEATYAGIPRIGITIKATGQLNGALSEVRTLAVARPAPVWTGAEWATQETSNPGAQMLQFARGIYDETGRLVAGYGKPDDEIDIDALKGFMLHCAANNYTYDYWLTSQRSRREVMDTIALAGFGQFTRAGGKLSVVWAAQDQPLQGVVNMATIKKRTFQVDYSLANAADGVEFTYWDAAAREAKTLQVPAPGVEIMLNPSQVEGEGVTTEAHAAQLARYHLAQSLYQYKAITYGTDLEVLSYRRLSKLALQHDMTQWGFGGTVLSATPIANGRVVLELDEPVPAPATGNAYIGVRIPGEMVYRVFTIQPFAGTSTSVTLTEAWPGDADLPGSSDGNPAHDTIWIYDFKQTPGYQVRVVGIEMDTDTKGATVSVVPESPEFWTYVKTGAYVPPVNDSLLPTRPVVTAASVSENQVVQGDTVFTELSVLFDVTGTMAYAAVLAALPNQELREVVPMTRSTNAVFRIGQAGTYTVVVRPFDTDGVPGGSFTTTYATIGAETAPNNVDWFEVEDQTGGVRKYSWGYDETSIEPADLAGVEVRYVDGQVGAMDWPTATPLGEGGYHTAAFEMVLPAAGQWTFGVRARNTSGLLSPDTLLVTKTLGKNVGENFTESEAAQAALNLAITKEIQDRIAADVQLAQDILDQVAGIDSALGAAPWDEASTYASGAYVVFDGRLYRSKQANNTNHPVTDAAWWLDAGTLLSLHDATVLTLSNQQQTITQQGQNITALGTQVSGVATQIAGKADASSVSTLSTQVQDIDGRTTSNASAITQVRARQNHRPNLIPNGGFERGRWTRGEYQAFAVSDGEWGRQMYHSNPASINGGGHAVNSDLMQGLGAGPYTLSFDHLLIASTGTVRVDVILYNSSNVSTGSFTTPAKARSFNFEDGDARRQANTLTFTAPAGTTQGEIRLVWEGVTGCQALAIRQVKLEKGASPSTDWSSEAQIALTATSQAASITLALQVNGYVSGIRSENTGTTSTFDVMADTLRIVAPNGGERFEYSAGNFRVYDGNGVLVVRGGKW